jgi:hypothetical protein
VSTKARSGGAYRLLILDGHESHNSVEFNEYCSEHKIITLCMPAHSSHLLQPLDVGCFSPLKRAYSAEISALAQKRITHITKLEFLPAFKKAFDDTFSQSTIQGAFRGAGLVPHNPDAVILKLDVRPITPAEATELPTAWHSQTPSNAREFEAQSTLICERIRAQVNSSPNSVIESLEQLQKRALAAVHQSSLVMNELAELRATIEAKTAQKSCKRKYIQKEGILTVTEGAFLASAKDVNSHVKGGELAEGSADALST